MSGVTGASRLARARAGDDREAALAASARASSGGDALDRAPAAAPRARSRVEEALDGRRRRPRPRAARRARRCARSRSGRARAPAGTRTGGSRRPGPSPRPAPRRAAPSARRRSRAAAPTSSTQHVVGARLRLLDARDVLRARDDHVVGEPLGRDPAAVVADHRDRREAAARAPRASAAITFARAAAGRERQQRRRPAARRRSPGARRSRPAPMSLAIAVRIAGSSVRSSAGAGQPRRRAKSATTSIASVAEPPLPSASSLPPAVEARRAASAAAASSSSRSVGERLLAQRADLLGLHHAPRRARRRAPPRGRARCSPRNGYRKLEAPASCTGAASRPSSRPRCSKNTCTSSHSTW